MTITLAHLSGGISHSTDYLSLKIPFFESYDFLKKEFFYIRNINLIEIGSQAKIYWTLEAEGASAFGHNHIIIVLYDLAFVIK